MFLTNKYFHKTERKKTNSSKEKEGMPSHKLSIPKIENRTSLKEK